jgi:DNA repair protein RecO (recombination protein O)
MRHREDAICLRATDYSETSQVVCFLTRSCGVVSLMAKGSKRPKSTTGGAIDLLSEGDLVFLTGSQGGMGTLVEFSETVSRGALRADARRLNASLYMIESARAMLAEDDPHPEVFDLLHNALARLAEADAPLAAVVAYYQWRLLRNVGLMGQTDKCVSCGLSAKEAVARAGGRAFFSSSLGGVLCSACAASVGEKTPMDRAALAGFSGLALAAAGGKPRLTDDQARAVSRLLAYHIDQQLGRPLKMERYVIDQKRG